MNAGVRTRRLASGLLGRAAGGGSVLFVSASITFIALHIMPGDPVMAMLGGPTADPSPAAIAAARHEYGLDRPLAVQYGLYLWRLLHGDLGVSFSQHMRVAAVLREQAGPTIVLTLSALAASWIVALLSVLVTTRRNRWLDGAAASVETVGASLPHFWLGIVLLWVFAFRLQWLPPAGNSLAALILPTVSLAIPLGGFIGRVTRDSFAAALDQPFVLSARTRGLSDWQVRVLHVLRHAVLPGLGLSAWAVAALLGNAVVVETIFSRRGIGRQLFEAVSMQDMPLASGIVLFVTCLYVIASLLIEMLSALIDPRLQGARR